MTEAECRAEIRKFFMELYPACTVIYSYPGNAARPPAPYVVLDFDAADSSQIDEYVDDGILQQTWYMSMPFSAELVAQSKVVHGGGVKKALLSTAVDDLAQSIRFFQSSYAEDKMRLLNISVTATGNPEQIHNSVSGVERARCSFLWISFRTRRSMQHCIHRTVSTLPTTTARHRKSLQICRLDISQKLKLNHKSRNKGVRA